MHSDSMSDHYQRKTPVWTCAFFALALLEGKLSVVWEGNTVYLDPPCAETPRWAVQCSAHREKHVFELSWTSKLFSSPRPAKWSLWRWSHQVLQGQEDCSPLVEYNGVIQE